MLAFLFPLPESAAFFALSLIFSSVVVRLVVFVASSLKGLLSRLELVNPLKITLAVCVFGSQR